MIRIIFYVNINQTPNKVLVSARGLSGNWCQVTSLGVGFNPLVETESETSSRKISLEFAIHPNGLDVQNGANVKQEDTHTHTHS